VLDQGRVATLTIDTTLVGAGTFPLLLSNVAANNGGPFSTDLIDSSGKTIPLTIINGSITVPEPAGLPALGLFFLVLLRRRSAPSLDW
jgi:MYXO-CTERM domain-containing protein